MTAHTLVNAGMDVLMVERGDWVSRGPHNWSPYGTGEATPFYSKESPYRILAGGRDYVAGAYNCVGGPSVFYGGVSMRMREADFEPGPEIVLDSGASWPFKYRDLEPFYVRAEKILNVAGDAGRDPTEPSRSDTYPQSLNGLSGTARVVQRAGESLGLRPFRLPLAINYESNNGRAGCEQCPTCDSFACAIGAKNDLPTVVLPQLIEQGLHLKTNTVALGLVPERRRIAYLEAFDKKENRKIRLRARQFILSAGALGSPHLLLASQLEKMNSGGRTIGRYLTRHCNAIVYGIFPPNGKVDPNHFQKQLGFHDFYFGHQDIKKPKGKLGCLQQMQSPPIAMVEAMATKPLALFIRIFLANMTGLVVMAEDQPQYQNRVAVNWQVRDAFGLPQLLVSHHYSKRDYAARKALMKQAKRIIRRAGAVLCYVHKIKTFSHAVGTVRTGSDPYTSALDEYCQFRGISNLFVVDGSFKPTASGVNPSLTISANALRVGEHIVQTV